jgi:hypothetical protein
MALVIRRQFRAHRFASTTRNGVDVQFEARNAAFICRAIVDLDFESVDGRCRPRERPDQHP